LENYPTDPVPNDQPVKKSSRAGCVGYGIDALETVILALILFFSINAVSDRVRVENISMQPTLYQGEFLLVNKLAYKLGSPHIGDIIIFPYPGDPQEKFIKRVIGLPGDVVKIQDGVVYINDQALIEPYISQPPNYNGTWTVPQNSLFVLGDNRNNSNDSHAWGFVPINTVIGKALVIYWPLDKLQNLTLVEVVKAAP
jgi:signal peptidase I